MNVDGLARVDERRDRAAVERALAELETRVESNLENGDVSCHIGEEEFAVILSDATADRAEAFLAALRASLERPRADRVRVARSVGGHHRAGVGRRRDERLRPGRARSLAGEASRDGDCRRCHGS